jgi:hypothetical protein
MRWPGGRRWAAGLAAASSAANASVIKEESREAPILAALDPARTHYLGTVQAPAPLRFSHVVRRYDDPAPLGAKGGASGTLASLSGRRAPLEKRMGAPEVSAPLPGHIVRRPCSRFFPIYTQFVGSSRVSVIVVSHLAHSIQLGGGGVTPT